MASLFRLALLLRVTICSLVLCVLPGGAAAADDIQKAADAMMDRARQLSDIRSPNAPGFRLSLTFSFAGHDLETLKGTYTEVWVSNSQWRREMAIGDHRRIEIGGAAKHWLVDGGYDFPEEAARVATLVEMFPPRSVKFEYESFRDPDSATQCAITKPMGEKRPRFGFCFDKDNRVLVENVSPRLVGNRFADYSCRYGQFRKFGDYWFPRDMACFVDAHQKIEAKVVDLSPLPSPDPALFTPPSGAVEIGSCSGSAVPPRALRTPNPQTPSGMRDHLSKVGLSIIVDSQGIPQGLKITQSVGKQLDDSAMAAVRNWRFKPGTCNGEPMALPINIQITFGSYP